MIAFYREDDVFYGIAADTYADFQKLDDQLSPVMEKYGIVRIEEVDAFTASLDFSDFLAVPWIFEFSDESKRSQFILDYEVRVFDRQAARDAHKNMLSEFNKDLLVSDQRPISEIHDMDMDDEDDEKIGHAPQNDAMTTESFMPISATIDREVDGVINSAHFTENFFNGVNPTDETEIPDFSVVETDNKIIVGDGDAVVEINKSDLLNQETTGGSINDLLKQVGVSEDEIAEAKAKVEIDEEDEEEEEEEIDAGADGPSGVNADDQVAPFTFEVGGQIVTEKDAPDSATRDMMRAIASTFGGLGATGVTFVEDDEGTRGPIQFPSSDVETAFRVDLIGATDQQALAIKSTVSDPEMVGPIRTDDIDGVWFVFAKRRTARFFAEDARSAGFQTEEYLVNVPSGEPVFERPKPKATAEASGIMGEVFGDVSPIRPWTTRAGDYSALDEEGRALINEEVVTSEFYFATLRNHLGKTLVYLVPIDHYIRTGEFYEGPLLLSEKIMAGLHPAEDSPIPNTYYSRAEESVVVKSLQTLGFVESLLVANDLNGKNTRF